MVDLASLATQFSLGILTALSPCLFPLMPSYLAIIARENDISRTRMWLSLISLIAGLMIVYVTLGLFMSYLLSLFQIFLKNYASFAILQGILLVLIGLMMIYTPSFLSSLDVSSRMSEIIHHKNLESNTILLSFLIGLFFTIIAIPCAASYFLLSWTTASTVPLLDRFLGLVIFSIGASLPFVIITLLYPELKATFVQTMNKGHSIIKSVLGVIVMGSGVWLIGSIF